MQAAAYVTTCLFSEGHSLIIRIMNALDIDIRGQSIRSRNGRACFFIEKQEKNNFPDNFSSTKKLKDCCMAQESQISW